VLSTTKEYSLRDFDPRRASDKKAARSRLAHLADAEQGWVREATGDEDYAIALSARNPMIHGRLKRTVYASTHELGPHEGRTGFPVGRAGSIIDSRPLIELCSAVATRHLESFLVTIATEQE
jgi:hypothetical protein